MSDKYNIEKPNILLLVADDLGWSDVSYLGSQIQTPNIDNIGAEGAILNQFYVMPSCSPTRASMMTGRYTIRYGMQVSVIKPSHKYGLPVDEKILPQSLKEVGYETAIVGKWHLGLSKPEYLPTNRGFDHQYGCYNGMIDYEKHNSDMYMDWEAKIIDPECMEQPDENTDGHDWNSGDENLYEKGYATDLIRDEAIRVIKERDREKPLFLYVPFTAPHTPLQAKDLDLAQYENMDLAVPRIFKNEDEEAKKLRLKRRRFYASLVSNMDAAIGRILETIDDEKIRENTLIVFLSDNGASYQGGNNDPLKGQKALLYEGGVRVPAVMSFSGKIPKGTLVDEPMHVVDLYPTLCKLAGVEAKQDKPLDGLNVWPTISEGEPTPHEDILINAREGRSSAIRMGDWKLVRNGHLGPVSTIGDNETKFELFNLKDDPNEKNNLIESNQVVFEKLKKRLDEYTEEAVPHLYTTPEEYVTPKIWKPFWWQETSANSN
jgi:arylsulfatase A-like enzyme